MKNSFQKYKTGLKTFLIKFWGNDFGKVSSIFLISRIIVLLIGFLGAGVFSNSLMGRDLYMNEMTYEKVWSQWDIPWYKAIATEGYEKFGYSTTTQTVYGFMPLYPYAVGTVIKLTPFNDFMIIGSLLSNLFSLGAVYFFYKYTKKLSKHADRFLIVYCFLPGTLYLSVPYTESLYLLIASLVFFLTQKKYYLFAFALCGLAIITRVQALALLIVPLTTILLSKELKLNFKLIQISIGLIISSVPLVIFMFYLNNITGDPIAFLNSQKAWNNTSAFPLGAFTGFIFEEFSIRSAFHCMVWLLYGFFFIKNYKKMLMPEILFSLAIFAISTSTEIFYGTYRYILPLIPLFRFIAEEKGIFKEIYFYISFILLTILTTAFVTPNTLAV